MPEITAIITNLNEFRYEVELAKIKFDELKRILDNIQNFKFEVKSIK